MMCVRLTGLAREAIEVSSEIFGPGSDVTLNNQMNALLIEQAAPT
jgi:hypothetical protein